MAVLEALLHGVSGALVKVSEWQQLPQSPLFVWYHSRCVVVVGEKHGRA